MKNTKTQQNDDPVAYRSAWHMDLLLGSERNPEILSPAPKNIDSWHNRGIAAFFLEALLLTLVL